MQMPPEDPDPPGEGPSYARLTDPHVAGYLGPVAVEEVSWLLEGLRPLHRTGRRPGERNLNRDLFPRDEFLAE